MFNIFKIKMFISAQLKKVTADSVDVPLLTSNVNQGKNMNICLPALNMTNLKKDNITYPP